MNQPPEVTFVKNEFNETCRKRVPHEMKNDSIEEESDCLVQTKINIKTEPQEDENESSVTATTFYILCPKRETDEQMVKTKHNDPINETVQNTLDVGSDIKVASEEHLSSDLEDKQKNQTEEEESDLRNDEKPEFFEKGKSKSKKQLLVRKKRIYKYENHTCYVCHKIFKSKGDLSRHSRVHTGETPFTCQICTKSFSVKSNLDKHLLIHSGEKPYKCDVCNKSFRLKADVDKHKVTHSSVKSFSCSECNKSFKLKHALDRHKLIHTNYRPCACDQCDKAFRNESDLNRHRLVHTGERPHSCHICNKSFAQKQHLNTHNERIHKK